MMIWTILIGLMAILNVPLQLMNWWLVFGIWPKSWLWFIFFAAVSYGQQELAKFFLKRLIKSYQDEL